MLLRLQVMNDLLFIHLLGMLLQRLLLLMLLLPLLMLLLLQILLVSLVSWVTFGINSMAGVFSQIPEGGTKRKTLNDNNNVVQFLLAFLPPATTGARGRGADARGGRGASESPRA